MQPLKSGPKAEAPLRGQPEIEPHPKAPEPSILRIRHLTKVFVGRKGEVVALEDFSLNVKEGEFVSIVGPSGCGKSTLLNLVIGLLLPTEGEILYNGQPVRGVNTEIGYVTQQDHLMPWRTLIRNVEFGLEVRGTPRGERRRRAQELIDQVGLSGFEHHYPHELSGGMRQRANLIRTLAYNPQIILMDEPFGALDAQTRLKLQDQLLKLWEREKKTILFITHDLVEAISLSDRVVVMKARPGRVKAVEPIPLPRPRDVFRIQVEESFHEVFTRLWTLLGEELQKG